MSSSILLLEATFCYCRGRPSKDPECCINALKLRGPGVEPLKYFRGIAVLNAVNRPFFVSLRIDLGYHQRYVTDRKKILFSPAL